MAKLIRSIETAFIALLFSFSLANLIVLEINIWYWINGYFNDWFINSILFQFMLIPIFFFTVFTHVLVDREDIWVEYF